MSCKDPLAALSTAVSYVVYLFPFAWWQHRFRFDTTATDQPG